MEAEKAAEKAKVEAGTPNVRKPDRSQSIATMSRKAFR
jgi:hypothetical protein